MIISESSILKRGMVRYEETYRNSYIIGVQIRTGGDGFWSDPKLGFKVTSSKGFVFHINREFLPHLIRTKRTIGTVLE